MFPLLYPDAFCECAASKEFIDKSVPKTAQLGHDCDRLEKLCEFLQERLNEVNAYHIS